MSDKKAESTNFTIVKERKWWWKVFVGGIILSSFLLALCVVWFWSNRADKTDQNPIATPDPVAQATPSLSFDTLAARAEPEPTPEPPSPAEEPAAVSPSAPDAPAADPTDCTFLNDNRPKVDGKYVLQCAEGQFLATGTYNGENFDWSGFEAHTP